MAIYEEFVRPFRWRVKHLSDKVPWRSLAAPGVLLHKQSHALQRTYALRGPDLLGETPETQGALMLAANNALKRLLGSWTIHSEARRARVTDYPEGQGFHPGSRLLDADRQAHLMADPGLRETVYFLTLTWKPPSPLAQRWNRVIVTQPASPQDGDDSEEVQQGKDIDAFIAQTDQWMALLRGILATSRRLTTDETLTYLHSTVSDTWHPVRCPGLPIDLDVRLCDRDYTGGWAPQLGSWHLRTCSLIGYPSTSVAGGMRGLERLDLDFRWVTRWIALEKQIQANLLRQMQGAWAGQQRSFAARIAESISGRPTEIQNNDARNKAEQVDVARQEIGADLVAFGELTGTVTTWDTDPRAADLKLREIMQVFEAQGFTVTPERQHAMAAWLSSHPGNRLDSVRRTPHHSLTVAHLAPGLSSVWPGEERDAHLNAPAWFVAETDGHTRVQVANHVLDNGHFKLLGPTRSGKSTFLAFLVAQWLERYAGAQAFPFDVDLSMRCLTLCLGGLHVDVGAGDLRIQPLRLIGNPLERAWAGEWLLQLLTAQGVVNMPGLHGFLGNALDTLAQAPAAKRTLSELRLVLRTKAMTPSGRRGDGTAVMADWQTNLLAMQKDVQDALDLFVRGGRLGHVLDHDMDDLSQATERLITFEQKTLLTLPKLINPTLSAIFHRLEGRFDTHTPTLLPMDEFAILAAIPEIAEQGKAWLMTRAKKNVSLGFATHSIAQIFGDPHNVLGALMLEGCASTFVMPNPAARTPQMAEIYHRLGFNSAEVQTIATARPQRDIYYAAALLGKRLLHLNLSPLALAMVARNTQEDHAVMDDILQREGREGFTRAWLDAQGFPEAAAQMQSWQKERNDAETDGEANLLLSRGVL
jgi:type IV secretory pathway VirB4 component